MARLDGEFTFSKPAGDLKEFKIWMTRPMTVKIIAKIQHMEVSQTCSLAPNGFNYTDSMSMNAQFKALGQTIAQKMDVRISDLTLR